MTMTKLVIAILAPVVFATGCYTTKINFSPSASGTPHADWQGRYHHGLVYGLVELSAPVPLNELCPAGIGYVVQETTFMNGFIEGLTYHFYNPQSVTVYCAGGSATRAIINEAGEAVAYLEPGAE